MEPQLKAEIRFLTTRLGHIIREQAGDALYSRLEQLRVLAKEVRKQQKGDAVQAKRRVVANLKPTEAYQVAHAFSLFFQLVNLCISQRQVWIESVILRDVWCHFVNNVDSMENHRAPRAVAKLTRRGVY